MYRSVPPPYQTQYAPYMHFRIKSLGTSYHHLVYLFLLFLITVLLATNLLSFLAG
jgi:hypothetical protein